jgi:hypothetical protein
MCEMHMSYESYMTYAVRHFEHAPANCGVGKVSRLLKEAASAKADHQLQRHAGKDAARLVQRHRSGVVGHQSAV